MKRRQFLQASGIAGASVLTASAVEIVASHSGTPAARRSAGSSDGRSAVHSMTAKADSLPDLTPARWIWYPSERTLPNTFVLFRRELRLSKAPIAALGWISADSRYRMEVNGQRVQWGPAPSDPRWPEADPVALTEVLHPGDNVLGITVLYFGHGDGTWPLGRPGFLFWLKLQFPDGSEELVTSDNTWQTHLCRAWEPGRFKRWYLRALQEQFDARLYPYGWNLTKFSSDANWLNAVCLEGSPNKPALATNYKDYLYVLERGPEDSELHPRSIPLVHESLVPVKRLGESLWIQWRRSPLEYFENRTPESFRVERTPSAVPIGTDRWHVHLEPGRAALMTFELTEQVAGFPYFTITAPAGTTVDLMTQEGHQLGGEPLLYTTTNYGWARFICREGVNHFECFDHECLRWIQLHVLGEGMVTVDSVGVRRRLFPWKYDPVIKTDEPPLQRLFDANINTILNAAADQFVDAIGRERQQYSGDCAHQVATALLVFGDKRLPARYLRTWGQGQTLEGYFLDCWPAYDRLERIAQRQMNLSTFGPILDHGVQFGLDVWNHYQITGDLEPVAECCPRMLRFTDYLTGLINRDGDGLLPVTDLGVPCVFLDFDAYSFRLQRRKQCSFNLYVAAMLDHALAPMCEAVRDYRSAAEVRKISKDLLNAAVKRFWDTRRRLFVDNLPWLEDDGTASLSDQTLARSILFDQCPGNDITSSLTILADCPAEMGFSYPPNAIWRLWALAKGHRIDAVLKDLRTRWASLPSVVLNNTIQELWEARPDSGSLWSHCSASPLSIAHLCLVGLRPLEPGFKRAELQPQLGDLRDLQVVTYTGQGPLQFSANGHTGDREMSLSVPYGCDCDLLLSRQEIVSLQEAVGATPAGYRRYRLPSGATTVLRLKLT